MLISDMAELALEGAIPDGEVPAGRQPEELAEIARRWLEYRSGWLLIIDSAAAYDDLASFLPRLGQGHVIVTTTAAEEWRGVGRVYEVDVFGEDMSVQFLVSRSRDDDAESAARIASTVGYLPLALEQVGSYVAATPGVSLKLYEDLFRERTLELLERGAPTSKHVTITATYSLLLEGVSANGIIMSRAAAFLDADAIPVDILLSVVQVHHHECGQEYDALLAREDVSELVRLGLLRASGNVLRVHKLLQLVMKRMMDEGDIGDTLARLISVLAKNHPASVMQDPTSWSLCDTLTPHIGAVATHARSFDVMSKDLAYLLDRSATYQQEMGRQLVAAAMFREALDVTLECEGGDAADLGQAYCNLGIALRATGEYPEAEQHLNKAIDIVRSRGETESRSLSILYSNLALVYKDVLNLEAALRSASEALRISLLVEPLGSPTITINRSVVGCIRQDMDDLVGAEVDLALALRESRELYGEVHPTLVIRLNNLAGVVLDMGRTSEALALFGSAVEVAQLVYESNHPRLGMCYRRKAKAELLGGNPDAASSLFQSAKTIMSANLPGWERELVIACVGMGDSLLSQGLLALAGREYEEASRIAQDSLGPTDPLLREARAKLAHADTLR